MWNVSMATRESSNSEALIDVATTVDKRGARFPFTTAWRDFALNLFPQTPARLPGFSCGLRATFSDLTRLSPFER